jgi:hypothetical protein
MKKGLGCSNGSCPRINITAYALLADLVVLFHLLFVLFVVAGGFLTLRWPWLARLHLPAAAWGAIVEFSGSLCPLTLLENWLRTRAGGVAYETDFISHYGLPILHPADLTRDVQIVQGLTVLILNGAAYALLWRKYRYGMN